VDGTYSAIAMECWQHLRFAIRACAQGMVQERRICKMNKDDIHVMPVNDLREYVFDNCPCNPRIAVEGANLIYTHKLKGSEG
jgi:hypothetical protein